MGITTPPAESAYFGAFFRPNGSFQYQGQVYYNTLLSMQAPYMPVRTIYSASLLQANDPLVHYLASDLNAQTGATAQWANGIWLNGVWRHNDDLQNLMLPTVPVAPIGGRFQPWGQNYLMASIANVDTNGYNLAYKDPLVWSPDSWNFPSNLLFSLAGLGQVHRGTPWQTIYLKSTDILQEMESLGGGSQNVGTNTWANWTGDLQPDSFSGQYVDAALMAPVSDWRLAGLLMSLLNTNYATQLFSVNDPNSADWQNLLNGLTVYSNSNPNPLFTPTFDTYVMAANSSQASTVAIGIANVKTSQPGQNFYFVGDVLSAPEMTVSSPWLNTADALQLNYGISDAEYEAIPAQLLPLLRPDSSRHPDADKWRLEPLVLRCRRL